MTAAFLTLRLNVTSGASVRTTAAETRAIVIIASARLRVILFARFAQAGAAVGATVGAVSAASVTGAVATGDTVTAMRTRIRRRVEKATASRSASVRTRTMANGFGQTRSDRRASETRRSRTLTIATRFEVRARTRGPRTTQTRVIHVLTRTGRMTVAGVTGTVGTRTVGAGTGVATGAASATAFARGQRNASVAFLTRRFVRTGAFTSATLLKTRTRLTRHVATRRRFVASQNGGQEAT